jgi:hypothetical protein
MKRHLPAIVREESISMSKTWFRPWGPIYRPTSVAGYIVTILILAFCVQVFLYVDGRSHSVTDTLYGVFPYIVPSLLLWERIAAHTCGRP